MYISRGGTCMNKRMEAMDESSEKPLLMKWELVFMTGN